MPILDMSLKELKTYRGTNPQPEDFYDYWDKALREIPDADGTPEYRTADFTSPVAECRHLTFNGVGGSGIHVKALLPKKQKAPYPALLHFHGYTASSSPWTDYLEYAGSGIAVFAMDCRGQGGLSEDLDTPAGPTLYGNIVKGLEGRAEHLHYRRVFQDTVQLARIVMDTPDINADRVGVYGGSQGGGLSLACAALEPRICCAAPLYPFLSDYKRVWEMDMAERAYKGLREYFRIFDPLHEREEEIFRTLGYIDVANLAPRICGEVLFGITLMDDICPPSTQFAAFNRIQSSKELVIFPDFGHEDIPLFKERRYRFLIEKLLES